MISLSAYLDVECDLDGTDFKVYIVHINRKVEITPVLTEYELKTLRLKYDVKAAVYGFHLQQDRSED